MSRTVLIVDDEKLIVDILKFNLEREGFCTLAAYDGTEGLEMARGLSPDLILLDVMLPGLDGFEVCRTLRAEGNQVPIIMITAREEETDKVLGLDLGADDYITKPFASMRELIARVGANMRRMPAESAEQEEPVLMQFGALAVDNSRQSAFKNGVNLDLTQREFELLRFLAASPGTVYSREELMNSVWRYDYYGNLRAVDVAVRRLREKVEDNPDKPIFVQTKRAAGYFFSESL